MLYKTWALCHCKVVPLSPPKSRKFWKVVHELPGTYLIVERPGIKGVSVLMGRLDIDYFSSSISSFLEINSTSLYWFNMLSLWMQLFVIYTSNEDRLFCDYLTLLVLCFSNFLYNENNLNMCISVREWDRTLHFLLYLSWNILFKKRLLICVSAVPFGTTHTFHKRADSLIR